jgi:hypothetical protein
MSALGLKIAGYGAVAAICAVTVAANVSFAVGLGVTPTEKAVFGAASSAIDVLKFLALVLATRLWHRRRRILAGGCAIMGVMCLFWSMASAVGFVLNARAITNAMSAAKILANDGWFTTVTRAETRLGKLGQHHRPLGVIQAELVAAQAAAFAVWERTTGCTNITRPDSLATCQPILSLRRELSAAEEVGRLEHQVEQGRTVLQTQPVTARAADPQVAGLVGIIGLDEPTIRHGLAVLLALLIEGVSATGFAIVAGATAKSPLHPDPPCASRRHHRPSARRQTKLATNVVRLVTSPRSTRPASARHATALDGWLGGLVPSEPTTQMAARPTYMAYRHWAERGGLIPASETSFGKAITARVTALGGTKRKARTGTFYVGVRLDPARTAGAAA